MNSISDILAFGPYVWSAFGICAGALAVEVLSLRARRRRAARTILDDLHEGDTA